MNNALAHLTIENVERLAAKIVAAYPGVSMADARELAEFNLTHATSYAEAAGRVAA